MSHFTRNGSESERPHEGHSRRIQHMDLEGATEEATNTVDKPLVHGVAIPPRSSLGKQVRIAVKETFFPDDPLRQFKGQQGKRKWYMALAYVFPIVDWLPKYSLTLFKGDLIAGLTIASLAIPQDLGYAKLANLDPIHGLYSSFVPPLIYSVLGSSKDIAIGPVAVVSILMGQLLKDEVDPVSDKETYLRLAFTATFFAGVVQAGLGILRLGFIIDFLSHAAIIGFMAGAAVTIALQQLKGLLGISHFTTNTDIISVMRSVWTQTDEWNWQTICIGVFFLIILLATKRIAKMRKKLFWIAAMAPLVSVILSTLFVFVTRADKHGVKTVRKIEKGVNPSSLREIYWTGKFLSTGFKVGLVAGLVGLTEAVAIGRTFAALKDYHIDGNKEMIAIGTMNVAGSFTSCYVATGSFSRSAVNYQSGCKTAMANIVMSVVVLFVLLFLTPLFYYTPNCILAAIIISAVLNLIDFDAAYLVWKTDKVDFLVLVGAFFGVFFVSVEIGLLVAVIISFAKILLHVTRPHTAVLGNIPGTSIYRNVLQYPNATTEPGILIVRIDAAVYFSNSNYIRERIIRYVNEEEDIVKEAGGVPLQFIIIEMAPVMSIDTAAIHAFEELHTAMKKRGIQITISNPVGGVMEKFEAGGFVDLLGPEWFFLSVGEGVSVCSVIIKRNHHALDEGRREETEA